MSRSPSTTPEPSPATPKQIRGEQLIENVLEVTLNELARTDYSSLSFERIAEQAGVNRATLYRRWPTKRDLTLAALQRIAGQLPTPADTGTLQRDLFVYLRGLADVLEQPRSRALFRTAFSADGELHEMALSIYEAKLSQGNAMFMRAIARGEIPPETDLRSAQIFLLGALQNHVVFLRNAADSATLKRLVEFTLHGLACQAPAGPARRPARHT